MINDAALKVNVSLWLKSLVNEAPSDLNVLDFSTSNTILKNRWIKHDFQNKNKMWYLMGGFAFLLQCNFELSKIPVRLVIFRQVSDVIT